MLRREAAELLDKGISHIHSTALGNSDATVRVTRDRILGIQRQYPWTPKTCSVQVRLSASADRNNTIKHILASLFSTERTSTKESIKLIIEEMTTNAIYHSIHSSTGFDRYRRKQSILLSKEEAVDLLCNRSNEGAFISVRDQGGTLRLSDIAKCLKRCYTNQNADQIEKKEGGAGLGFYMAFESATHIDITVVPRRSTTINLWLPLTNVNPHYFSFNFWRGSDDTE